ncbi:MAG: nickel pincer cofactor biosynthesis protein LarC [Candidatus Omnitrophota bacterium]
MKIIYFDAFSGISGDMCLGALVDAGCPLEEIKNHLAGLNIPGFDLRAEKVQRGPLAGTQVHVQVEEEHHVHRHLADVLQIADRISWPGNVRQRIEQVFTALAQAEGKVHNKPFDHIHFHEVGCFDAIVDISGTLLGLHLLGVERFACSKIPVGEGFSGETQHGRLPLPVPATAELLRGFSLYSNGGTLEMVTPTGAALLNALCAGSSPMPSMILETVGYGAGSRVIEGRPNLLRVFLGEAEAGRDVIAVLETNIDDMNPEFFEPLIESLFQAGALDATLTPIMMKKNRPATQLTVLAPLHLKEELARVVLRQSSTIGLRFYECERRTLLRQSANVSTSWGPIRGKVSWGFGVEKRFTPEYDDCMKIHRETGVPIARIYEEAQRRFDPDSILSSQDNQ